VAQRRYGHAVGDDRLRTARDRRGLPLRGEELAAILPHTDLDGAIKLAELVCGAIAGLRVPHRENHEGGGIMTASIGVATALSCGGGTTHMPGALLQAADTALYKATQRGRNRVEAGLLITPIG
jgi:diguanylate cyclase (GGDEF)-like protein